MEMKIYHATDGLGHRLYTFASRSEAETYVSRILKEEPGAGVAAAEYNPCLHTVHRLLPQRIGYRVVELVSAATYGKS